MPAILKALSWAPICGRRCERYTLILLSLFFISYCLWEIRRVGANLGNLDAMLLSGIATFIFGLWLARSLPGRLQKTLVRLTHRCALVASEDQTSEVKLDDLRKTLERRADSWSRVVALVLAIAILIAFSIAFRNQFSTERVWLTIAEVVGAYIAGNFLGRMACYGQLGSILNKCEISIAVTPGHVDGAAGLKPVGDFFFFQAMVVAIPAVYLAVWWFMIPVWPRDYSYWRDPYLGLLAIAITIEVLAFLVPLWSFHRSMKMRKQKLITEADKLCVKMNEIQSKITNLSSSDEAKDLREQLSYITDQFWAIEKMPTWPVDIRTRRLFGMNNVLLFAPIISRLTKDEEFWNDILNIIKKFQV